MSPSNGIKGGGQRLIVTWGTQKPSCLNDWTGQYFWLPIRAVFGHEDQWRQNMRELLELLEFQEI